ncbi:MAG: system, mannose-specific component [Firmicutes bacterium]|jgi:mannose/fructose-specific phosphotransferase system component IIA|nr:system, mannose-specific component [Bacillota bacterium]
MMNLLILSNGNFAKELYHSMKRFYSNPDIDYIVLNDTDLNQYSLELQQYLIENTGDLLILCDVYGSTAFNEAAIEINKLDRVNNTALICGVNLPILFKLYGLKDSWNIENIKSFYNESEKNGVIVYSPILINNEL